jgi:hypothetical protein
MMTRVHVLLSAVLVSACAGGTTASPAARTSAATASSDAPRYRTVHIDTVAPEKLAQFADARRAWLDEVRRAGAKDPRGVFLQVGADRFYTLRPFARFAELDTRREEATAALARVPKAAEGTYDRLSDESLVFPHASEIWRVDGDFGYAPPAGPRDETTAACGRLVLEDTRPDPASEEAYAHAWDEVKRALTEARYPLTRVTFHSTYGTGRLVTFWLARSKDELEAAPSVVAAVAAVRGRPKAEELMRAMDRAVVHREVHDVTRRGDLSSF